MLYDASFYFLPIYLGYAAAKKLGASMPLGMLMGAILISPTLIAAATQEGGGVTEPALFGIILRWKRTMLGMFAGGALGSVVSGILGVTSYMAGGGTNFMIILNYLQGGRGNIIRTLIGIVVSIVVAAIVTYLFGFTDEELKELA